MTVLRERSPVARRGAARGSLLVRVRGLFALLVLLLMLAQLVEWLDASTELWPHRAVAGLCLLTAGGWAVALYRYGRPGLTLDAAVIAATVGAGWGLGRPGAVLALLVGAVQLRALYGGRRSALLAGSGILSAYVVVTFLTGGLGSVATLGTLTVVVGLTGLVLVIRLVGEALARHDLVAAWDAILTESAEELLTAATVEEVDGVAQRALGRLADAVEGASGGLWRPRTAGSDAVPTTVGELEALVRAPDGGTSGDLGAVLARLATHARLAGERIASERRFRVLAENSRDGIYLLELRPTLSFRYINRALEALLGQPASEVYTAPERVLDRVHPEDRAQLERMADERGVNDEPLRVRVLRDQDTVWVEVQETVVEDRGDELLVVQGVARDVTHQWEEREALRLALEQQAAAADELRRLDDMKSTFLRAVSHELRTPLTAVLGSSMTLRRLHDRLPTENVEQLLDAIQRQSSRLEGLLEDLLDVDRLSRGIVEPERSPTRLLELVRRTVDTQEHPGRTVEVEGRELVIDVDAPKVERIVDNLVRNAVKHTPEGTRVRVVVEARSDGALLIVEDDGPGLPDGLQGTIFEPFAQGPSASGAPSPGTGIGLALVSKLAELHGGRAWSERPADGGARFLVSLPGTTVAAADGELAGSVPEG